MTQTRERAKKGSRGRSRVPRSSLPQEEMVVVHNERLVDKQQDDRKPKEATPYNDIYVPPKLQQQQRHDDVEQYGSSSSSDTERDHKERIENESTQNGIRRVPSVIQDAFDEERARTRRIRTRQIDNADEDVHSPLSYHHSNSTKRTPTRSVDQQHESHRQFNDHRMRRMPDEAGTEGSDSGERYRRQCANTDSFIASELSSKSSTQYEPSLGDGNTSGSYTGIYDTEGESLDQGIPRHQQRLPIFLASVSTMASLESVTSMIDGDVGGPFAFLVSDLSGLFSAKQDVAICTMLLAAIELLVIMLQLTMCGIAPFQTNMMIGPFPDAFSIWGGKNPQMMLGENEWWRIITPSILSVGILHYAVNVYCLLGTGALFEREWGWVPWVFFLIIGSVGCSAFSLYFEPDTIAVGSSGALLGLYGAKLAQVILQTFCQAPKKLGEEQDIIPLGYLGSVLFSLILLFLLGTVITYIDFVGGCGGLLAGFSAGLVYFSYLVDGCCSRFFLTIIGFCSLIVPIGTLGYLFVTESETNEELADICDYFRSLFPEEYECGCMG